MSGDLADFEAGYQVDNDAPDERDTSVLGLFGRYRTCDRPMTTEEKAICRQCPDGPKGEWDCAVRRDPRKGATTPCPLYADMKNRGVYP